MASSCAVAEEAQVKVEDRGPVRLIAINRPHVRNAVNPATARQLYEAFRDFDSDSNARVAVLHGLGGTFCAGYDLKELAETSSDTAVPAEVVDGRGPMVSVGMAESWFCFKSASVLCRGLVTWCCPSQCWQL